MSNRSKKTAKMREKREERERINDWRMISVYYRRNPDKFVEEYLDVKIPSYQRFILRLFGKKWSKCQKNTKSMKSN